MTDQQPPQDGTQPQGDPPPRDEPQGASVNVEVTSPVPPADAVTAEGNKDACTMAMLAHLLGFFTGFVGPLIIWLVKKEEPFVEQEARESLNFQITLLIGYLIAGALTMVCIGFLLIPALLVVDLVFCIMGTMKAKEGQPYVYPFAIRLIN